MRAAALSQEPVEADYVLGLPPQSLLGAFNRAGVLAPADVHVALVLCRLAGEPDPSVALAAALAVRAPRAGHVLVDLNKVRTTVVAGAGTDDEAALDDLPWPSPDAWLGALLESPLVSTPQQADSLRPLRLEEGRLYLERYWRDERAVADELLRRALSPELPLDEALTADLLDELFPDDGPGLQRAAAARSTRRLFSVIAGGPGTGKTTTAARLLALLYLQRVGQGLPAPLVALAAPTGKAAARVSEAVHEEARRLSLGEDMRAWLAGLEASTVDRLLGRRAGSARFRHGRHNRLPHDLVVVDETSMMSLPLMARLLEAVRPDARLVLIGDPEQLTSVEAGAVLADIVEPSAGAVGAGAGSQRAGPAPASPEGHPGHEEGPGGALARGEGATDDSPVANCLTILETNHRFRGALERLAAAARAGDADAVMTALRRYGGDNSHAAGSEDIGWLDLDVATSGPSALSAVLALVGPPAEALTHLCRDGAPVAALDALNSFRLLCAHREGPDGAATLNQRIEEWLSAAGRTGQPLGGWYAGRPVVVTENDYGLGLFNGDMGVTLRGDDGRLEVAFQRGAVLVRVSPSRLVAVQTAFAMTAHRAQGSEFEEVAFIMPAAGARVLTRELFYTAITRARRRVTVVGSEAAIRAALERPAARASGLAPRLWGLRNSGPRPFTLRPTAP